MLSYRIALLSLCSVVFVGGGMGCNVNDPDPPVDRVVSFADEIQPIFTRECITCHRDGGLAANRGIAMRLGEDLSYESIVDQPSSQTAALSLVIPSDSAMSLLFLKISENDPPVGSTMPLFGVPLSSEDVGLIRDWIDQGALDN